MKWEDLEIGWIREMGGSGMWADPGREDVKGSGREQEGNEGDAR